MGVYFEKENVNTLFMDNEMILTFMMSQAQAESESLSGNVRWGHRKNFKDGKVYYHCKTCLLYTSDTLAEAESDYDALPIKANHRIAEAYTVVRYKAVKV